MPRQHANKSDADKVENTADSTKGAALFSTIGFVISQILLAGSLHLVWGLVEGLQIVESMGLFDAKVPANVADFLGNFGELASFDFVDTTALIDSTINYPENDAYSLNFQS